MKEIDFNVTHIPSDIKPEKYSSISRNKPVSQVK